MKINAKRILATLSALTVALCTTPVQPFANVVNNMKITVNAETCEWDFEFDASTGTILQYNGYETVVEIPPKIGDISVKKLKKITNEGNSSIETIVIPESITELAPNAFTGCLSLKNIIFADNSQLTSIESCMFINNWRTLENISFGNNSMLTSIGDNAFQNCSSLESVTFGNNSILTSIGENAFGGCTSLKSITIPDSVTDIGSDTFTDCSSLSKITVPCIMKFSEDVWKPNDDTVIVYNHVCNIYDTDYCICGDFKIYDGAVYGYYGNDEEVCIPSSFNGVAVTSIVVGNYSSSIKHIIIPESVIYIQSLAFLGWRNLETITFSGNSKLKGIENETFMGCSSLKNIVIPNSVEYIGAQAFSGCTNLKDITFAENSQLKKLGGDMVDGCSSLENITLPKNSQLTLIQSSTFWHCKSLKSITIPDSVTQITDQAFMCCSSLENVIFSEDSQLNTIYSLAFNECTSLKSINIPASVTRIYDGAFQDCSSLENVVFSEDSQLTKIDAFAFKGTSLKRIIIPDNVTDIGYMAFGSCSELTDVFIPDSVQGINEGFRSCEKLENVYYEGSEYDWKEMHFDNHNHFENVNIIYNSNYVTSASLVLDGTLKVNIKFIWDIDEYDDYIINGELFTTNKKILTYAVSAKDFMNDIVIERRCEEVQTFSIADMLVKYKEMPETANIASALENYCLAANAYFADNDVMNYSELYESVKNEIKDHPVNMGNNYYGSSLLLKSQTILRHYYTTNVANSTQKGDYFYIEEEIPAHLYSNADKYCVNDYVYKVLTSADTSNNLKNLCVALYNYGKAAANYKGGI